ncbi:MAG TPA: hypothetical protein VK964_20755 [Nocardioidaceae bacterium]|nr:hypothetical protein [Nocardioidaceae bacterium]
MEDQLETAKGEPRLVLGHGRALVDDEGGEYTAAYTKPTGMSQSGFVAVVKFRA